MPENDFYKVEESFVTFHSRISSLRTEYVSRKTIAGYADFNLKCAVIGIYSQMPSKH
jgi:hypothetical protein